MKGQVTPRVSLALAGTFLMAVVLATGASATNHLTKLDEVMAGAFGRPDIQFVEMKVECGQNDWAGKARLAFFNGVDQRVGEYVFPANPPSTCESGGNSVLVATQAFASLAGVPVPEFIMPPGLVPGSGKVCFEGIPEAGGVAVQLCLTYGNFSGNTEQASSTNALPLASDGICALQRAYTGFFGEPNHNDDFVLDLPAPRNAAGQTGEVVVPPRFVDVPASHPFFRFVEAMANAGITGGCGGGGFCPGNLVTRGQMAVFLLRAKEGKAYAPPACATQLFADVPCSSPYASWINELAARGVTSGCGGGNYCPDRPVTREQMAVFLLSTREGRSYSPPACSAQLFHDVPCSSPFAPWVNEMASRGITGGCGNGNFCPGDAVTRDQMSVFVSSVFQLPVPYQGCPPLPPFDDDHGDSPDQATVLIVDSVPLDGAIQVGRDIDFFAVDAAAGERIVIKTGQLSAGNDTILRLFAPDGTTLLAADDNGAGGLASRILFTARQTGTYFAVVSHRSTAGQGSYKVTAMRVVDDHGDSAMQATPLTVGGPALAGSNEVSGDVDFFSFSASDGQTLSIQTSDLGSGSDTIIRLYDRDGSTQIAFDDDGGGGGASRILFTFQADGRYYVSVRQFSSQGRGTYRISAGTP